MKKLILALLIIGAANTASAQLTFKVQTKIFIPGNQNVPVKYSSTKEESEEIASYTYDKNGTRTGSVQAVTKDWKPGTAFSFDPTKYPELKGKRFLRADIVQSDDKSKVLIYFWPFKQTEIKQALADTNITAVPSNFNDLVDKGSFYIDIKKRKPVSFKTTALNAGPLTLPFKVYLGSRDDVHTSNVSADVNAGIYFGQKWGRKKFINMPAEKTGRTHERYTSLNLIAGFSSLEIAATDNIDGSTKAGKVLAFSPGMGFGYHYDSFGIFLATGLDFPIGNSIASDWRFKNQPWIGFGVGFSIFGK